MGTKRSGDALDSTLPRPRTSRAKRTKLSPTHEDRSDSSTGPSIGSISEDSALRSTPPATQTTRHSSASSLESLDEDTESSSSISSSDSESKSDEDTEERIVTIGGPKKPNMAREAVTSGAGDLRSRLQNLLPQLATANDLLASQDGVNMEEVDDEEDHIEMNLGLGVLEEARDDDESSLSERDEDHEAAEVESTSTAANPTKHVAKDHDDHIMDDLLNRHSDRRKAGIEDID